MTHLSRLDHGAIGEHLTIGQDATLRTIVERFRGDHDLRLLAVLDSGGQPVGILREVDIRDLLFNPFGHALLANPMFKIGTARLLRPAMIETAWRMVAHTSRWKTIFEGLKQKTGSNKKAIVAVARRLLGVMFSLLRSGQAYRLVV